MVDMSPTLALAILFAGLFVGILLGYPVPFIVGGIALFVGLVAMGPQVVSLLRLRLWEMMTNYIMLAIPLFIFMGSMVEKSGCAERLYSGLYLWFGGVRGGLAISTILVGTVMAACVGIIAASVITLALIGVPSMVRRGYDKELISGSVCAGGCLGILIPPSIMLVIYGPLASISVGKLFIGAFGPGLLLSALYITYIGIRSWLNPALAPSVPPEERTVSLWRKLFMLLTGMVPPSILVLSVLGVIFFGIAAPTEAAACGALAATLLALAYRRLTWQIFKAALLETVRISTMALLIGWTASLFTGVFIRLGCGKIISSLVLAAPFGNWGAFALIMFVVFILGFLIDWIAIVFILVPIVTPIVPLLGFDPLWFAVMVCVNLQMALMTPPMAPAIFFLKGVTKPEWGIDTKHIIRGVAPFVALILIGLGVCVAFPDIIMWLPHQMIKF